MMNNNDDDWALLVPLMQALADHLHQTDAPEAAWEAFHKMQYFVSFYKTRMESAHDLITRMAVILNLFAPRNGGSIVKMVLQLARLSSRRSASFNRENLN